MTLLQNLLGGLSALAQPQLGVAQLGVAQPAAPRKTKREQVMYDTGRKHYGRRGKPIATIFAIDHKRLERNKYAPWGRGDLGGSPV